MPLHLASAQEAKPKEYPTLGKITRLDPRLDKLVPPEARLEKLAEGFDWSEGPVWVKDGGFLLFSDIPRNSVMKWSEKDGISVFDMYLARIRLTTKGKGW
ncbi:MAG: gluconolactonase [Planctomycetaceae bacterium]|nr:gluconolactonase [Planctomycetaceae bacterium]